MRLTGIHFLLTYKCTYECDHCFVYSSPNAEGVFTISQIEDTLKQMKEMDSIDTAYFEGGEPFLFYPLLLTSASMARAMGFKVGIVTNCYWATSVRDAELWLKPFQSVGIDDLSISEDVFHNPDGDNNAVKFARKAAENLGIPCGEICIEEPSVKSDVNITPGDPVVGGDVLFKGRAVDKLVGDLPRRDYKVFDSCPKEELENPGRLHLDPYGNLHVCQGIIVGNMFKEPLKRIAENYDPKSHPVISVLLNGGPAKLAEMHNYDTTAGFVDHCHLCFEVRRKISDQFENHLGPKQVYGITE